MEWRVQGSSVWALLLLLVGSFLQLSWAAQNGTVSNCLPLGEPASGIPFFSTQIPFYDVLAQSSEQRTTGSIVLHNLFAARNFIAGEIMVYLNRSWENNEEVEVSLFLWEADSSSADTLAEIGQMVQSSAAAGSLEGEAGFVPLYAAIFSWRVRESGNEDVTFQAALATANGTSFLILKYCTDKLNAVSPPFATTAIIEGDAPTILFRDSPTRRPLYVFRIDRITCTEDAHYYCITGPPQNFSLFDVTSTTATFSFQELLHINSTAYTSFTIHYTVSCNTVVYDLATGSMVETVNGSTAALSEVKQVEVVGLRPFYNYTCRLFKYVLHLNLTTIHPQAIQLVTEEDVPTAAPENVRVVNITSNSAVIVWDPIPPHLANGNVHYMVNISTVSVSHYNIEMSSRETVYRVTGIEADTIHRVTVTGHTVKGAGPVSEVVSFRTLIDNVSSSSSGPSLSVSPSAIILPTSTLILPTSILTKARSSIITPTSDIGVGTSEDTSVATPGDVAAIFMAILYVVTIAMVILVVAAVLISRHLTKKNARMSDESAKGDISKGSSPEFEHKWQLPGETEARAVQMRDSQGALSNTNC